MSKLVDEASTTHERIEITKNGHCAAVLMGADDYHAIRETIAVLSNPELVRSHLQGLSEVEKGDSLNKNSWRKQ